MSGFDNIYIGNRGANEDGVMRIGAVQGATFIAGISGVTTGLSGPLSVVIDSNGQLGTVPSSRRFKEDIHDMGDASERLLRLRPVAFRYRKPYADGSKPLQYGLIAEEVAGVLPELVAYGRDGQPESVLYHVLPAMLLNEVQRQHQLIEKQRLANKQQQKENSKQWQLVTEQQNTIARQQAAIKDLAARLAKLEALVAPAPLGR